MLFSCPVVSDSLRAQGLQNARPCYESESEVALSCPTLCDPMATYQALPSMGFSRQEYWSGLPFPSSGDLPNPGIKPGSPALPTDTLFTV